MKYSSIIILSLTTLAQFNPSLFPQASVIPPYMSSQWDRFRNSSVPSNLEITYCSNPADIGMSWDDGPTVYTRTVLDQLRQRNQTATFFIIGSNLLNQRNRDILLRAYNEGHQIGIHTWSHPELTRLSDEQVIAEIAWTALAIFDVIGVTPTIYRAPCICLSYHSWR
jgi:hypothetical protein